MPGLTFGEKGAISLTRATLPALSRCVFILQTLLRDMPCVGASRRLLYSLTAVDGRGHCQQEAFSKHLINGFSSFSLLPSSAFPLIPELAQSRGAGIKASFLLPCYFILDPPVVTEVL